MTANLMLKMEISPAGFWGNHDTVRCVWPGWGRLVTLFCVILTQWGREAWVTLERQEGAGQYASTYKECRPDEGLAQMTCSVLLIIIILSIPKQGIIVFALPIQFLSVLKN
jgi:hypothetical protein